MTVTLIAPTWNEIEAVKVVLPRIRREWVDEIIIVDGGSTDGTVEFCRELGFRVHTQEARGYGAALREAIAVSTGDYIIEFQPDGNSVPEMIPAMVAKIEEGYDLVIGSRYVPGATSYDDDRLTKVGNRIFTWLVNLLFRARYTDTLIGFAPELAREHDFDFDYGPVLTKACPWFKTYVRARLPDGQVDADRDAGD